jgi:hypothetical protein
MLVAIGRFSLSLSSMSLSEKSLFLEGNAIAFGAAPWAIAQPTCPVSSPVFASFEGEIPDFLEDTVGELTDGSDPSPTPPLRGEGLSGSPFPGREGGWGVRFSEFASGILGEVGNLNRAD